MIDSHLYLRETGESIPGRWSEAFPTGLAMARDELERRLRSHATAHTLVWLATTGRHPWPENVSRLLQLQPELRMVLLSGVPNDDEGLLAIQAGVRGYAHAYAVATLLQEVALVVDHGGLWLGPELMRRLVKSTSTALLQRAASSSMLATPTTPGQRPRASGQAASLKAATAAATPKATADSATSDPAWLQLTSRERQIAHAVAGGRSNKEIASLMRISQKTVKAHLGSVFQKLAVRDRLQLVVRMAGIDGTPEPSAKEVSR